jgi:hypothetical protein
MWPRLAFLVAVAACRGGDKEVTTSTPPPPTHVMSGPLELDAMFGPYDSRSGYCRAKAQCCCEGSVSALAAVPSPTGPWKSVDLLRAAEPAGRSGPWHLVIQTDAGWFGEFFGYVKDEGDVATARASIEIQDWLGLGRPQVILHLAYDISSVEDGATVHRAREGLTVIGLGPSNIPYYATMMPVHVDTRDGGPPAGWTAKVDSDHKGALRIEAVMGEPRRMPTGTVPVAFP